MDFNSSSMPSQDPRGEWVSSGLRRRVLLPLLLAVVLTIGVGVAVLIMAQLHREQHDGETAAAALRTMLEERTAQDVLGMQSLSALMMHDRQLQAGLRAGDRQALLVATAPFFEGMRARNGISHLYFIRPDRTVLLRAHHPEDHGDRIDRYVLQQAQRKGEPFWGYEQGPYGSYTLRLVSPWMVDGVLIGYLSMGVEFEELVAGITRALKADVLVAMDKSLFDRSKWESAQSRKLEPVHWDEFPHVVLLSRTTGDIPPEVTEFLARRGRERTDASFRTRWDDRVGQVAVTPLRNLRGEVVGDVVMIKDMTEMVEDAAVTLALTVGACLLIAAALMAFLHSLLGRVQKEVAARTARLAETQNVLALEQLERQRAEQQLALQNERNELLETRGRMVEELAGAKRVAEEALRKNEEVTASLLEAQSELMATAREAGRAEIATNVLHNVGNVLNSVNISAGVIGSALRNSRVSGLGRAMQLISAHANDLGDYLTRDDKGRMLPGYLHAVAEALEKEREAMLEEISRLVKSIDHIKDIVATQQSHAAAGNVIEPVPPSELADEALRMQGTALARHQVAVVRKYEPMGPVALDRGRVLQILVNLISNAKAAMAAMPHEQPHHITVRVERADDRLRFMVSDEGEGISAENLTRIFSHGFTTRKNGHGFGLHSSALTARQMGGTLSVASEGVGKGATFTLELPLQARAAEADEAAATEA